MMNKIQAGIENAPLAGDSGVFYRRMFCGNEEAWEKALEDVRYMADAALDIAVLGRKASGLPDDGNYGPVGTVRTIKQAGYEYLYYVDRMGDWNSIAFRVVEIGGSGGDHFVACKMCGWTGPMRNSPTKARLAWNTRAPILSAGEMEILEGME